MTDQPHYPYRDGDRAILGPDVTATADGMTICWKGAKYRRDHGAQPDIGDWYEAGCARDCSEQHTYKLGRCALSTEEPPEPTVSIGRVEDFEDGQPGIVLRSIPMPAWDALITVAKWVSRGKSFALDADPDIAPCYPDASARRALGALHDAGLLDQSAPAPAATQATEPHTGLVIQPYRNDRGDNVWVFRCWGSDSCDGWLSLDHHSEQSAERARDRHVTEEHAEQPEPATVTDPEYLRQQYATALRASWDTGVNLHRDEAIRRDTDAVMRVRDRHIQQLQQRLQLADELLATRDAELAAAKKTARGIGAWGVLQAIEQALPQGPTVAEAAADDARWWNGEKAGE